MTTITEQAGALAEQLRKCIASQGQAGEHETAAVLKFLRQIAALGDGDGLTSEQIGELVEARATMPVAGLGIGVTGLLEFARAIESAAMLPLRARIAELEEALDLRFPEEWRAQMQEQLAASQAREQELVEYFDAKRALEHTYVDEDASRHECLEAQARAVSAEMVVLQRKDGGDYDALHADRKATIEAAARRIVIEQQRGYAPSWIMARAAERAGRGEEI